MEKPQRENNQVPDTGEIGLCEVCGQEPGVGVAAAPGIPVSLVYGKNCLESNISYPYGLLVENTALIGGLQNAADWWKYEVRHHLKFFNKTSAEFRVDVQSAINYHEMMGSESPHEPLILEGMQDSAYTPITGGVLRIAKERNRQIEKGYTPEHDQGHDQGHDDPSPPLLRAARSYMGLEDGHLTGPSWKEGLIGLDLDVRFPLPPSWPWGKEAWKPSKDPIRNLERAGALIAAEIDRLLHEKGS